MNVQHSTFNIQRSTVRNVGGSSGSLDVECSTFDVQRCRRASSRAGLTLIEVMLALVILGTGLVALVTAAGRCISVARQAKNFETARELLARVEVEKPMQLEEEVEDIAGSGSFDDPSGFRWTRTVEQEGFEEDGLWRVTTEINWTEDKSARREQVVTLIYWPEEKRGGSFERR
jgi:prepilin-type N-terminal cleavage/methylation domain-containing protein